MVIVHEAAIARGSKRVGARALGSTLNAFGSVKFYKFVVNSQGQESRRPMTNKVCVLFVAGNLADQRGGDRAQGRPKK